MDSPTPTYTLTVEDVSRLFSEAGLPRSPRSVMRYCQKSHLVAIKDISKYGEKYFINEESAQTFIEQIKLVERQVAPSLGKTRQDAARRDMPRQDATDGEVEKLRAENLRLQIEGETKNQMFDRAMQKVFEVGRKVEQLETKLKQLEAPKE